MSAPLVLVQGPESAAYWIRRAGEADAAGRRYLVYDARSAQALAAAGLAFTAESSFTDEAIREKLREYEAASHALSGRWYADAPGAQKAPAGLFAYRGLNFYFLVVLRAFVFLEAVRRKEGAAEIWTTRRVYAREFREPLQWMREDSPFAALLETFGEKAWGFRVRLFDVPADPPVERAEPTLPALRRLLRARQAACPAKLDVLFSGNPRLLAPVEKAAAAEGLARTARTRPLAGWREWPHLFRAGSHVVPLRTSRPPASFDEKAFYARFLERRTFVVDGADFLPVVWPKIRNFLRFHAPLLEENYDEAERFLARVRPAWLVVEEDAVEFNKMLVHAARRKGIRTLVVQHGLPGDRLGFTPLVADRMAVWGESSERVLAAWGVESSRMVRTGCPKYDGLGPVPATVEKKRALCAGYGWDPAAPLALVTLDVLRKNALERFENVNPDPFQILEAARRFIAAARAVPGVNFIYKFHQGFWDAGTYARLAADCGGLPPNFRWATRGVALDMMAACDVLFNDISSAGIEAVLVGKPLVNVNFYGNPDFFDFKRHGMDASVRSEAELLELCKRLERRALPLAEWVARQEALVEPYVFSRDGGAAARIARYLKEGVS